MPLPFLRAALACCIALSTSLAHAQAWPSKPIRYVVPYPPAGATDILARIVADKLGPVLGQPVVVDNKPGAAGNIGTAEVARSPADGYTLVQGTVSASISVTLYSNLAYNFERDLDPVAMIGLVPNVMVVGQSVPARTVKEFIALAKAQPGKLNFGSAGSGSSIHMSGELFKLMAGIDMVHVPYKGSAPAMTDLIGGQVSVMFDNLPSSMPHIKSGKVRALAVTSAKRYPSLPDVPTVAEAGVPGYEAYAWFGILAPKGTPKEIVSRLNAEVLKILQLPDVKEKLDQQGAIYTPFTPDDFRAFIKTDVQKWSKVVKASGAKVD